MPSISVWVYRGVIAAGTLYHYRWQVFGTLGLIWAGYWFYCLWKACVRHE